MNLVGKIFTVLICLFCVVLMALSMVVYATHTNWQKKALALGTDVENERKAKADLEQQHKRIQEDLATQKKLLTDSAAALQTEKKTLEADVTRQRTELTNLDAKQREAVAKMQKAQEQYTTLKARADKLEETLRKAEQDRDASFNETVKKTDELHQIAQELANLKKANTTLVADIAKYRKAAERMGVDLKAAELTPPVDGRITVVSTAGSRLMQISVGSDQGLAPGHQLEVSRISAAGPQYLGRVEVVSTTPHNAAVKAVPGFQLGAMKEGDNVTNKFKQ